MTQVTDGSGPTSSLPYGAKAAMQQDARDLNAAAQPPQAPPPPGADQQGVQPTPQAPAPAQPGVPPSGAVPPNAVQPAPPTQRLDPTAVFSPPRVGPAAGPQGPWRQHLLRWASHPQASVGLRALAAAVAPQRGPLDSQQQAPPGP